MHPFRQLIAKVFKDPDFQDTFPEEQEFRQYHTAFDERIHNAEVEQHKYAANLISKYYDKENLTVINPDPRGYSTLVKLYLETEITKYPFPLLRAGRDKYILNTQLSDEQKDALVLSLASRGYYLKV